LDGVIDVLFRAWAALEGLLFAGGLLAHKLALGLGAQSGLLALPVALGLFAHRGADRLRRNTSCVALGRSAYSLTLGAIILLTHVLRATNVALGLLAVNCALSARGLFTLHLTLRSLTYWVALSRAHRIVALPSAFRMARSLIGQHNTK